MKPQNRSQLLSLAIAGILTTGFFIPQNALASDLRENINIMPARSVSPTEERIMSRSAARVLRRIADARSAIKSKRIKQAKSDLNLAMTLINILKSQMPTTKVRDHIWVAKKHLDYENTEEVAGDLVPIESDLNEIDTFVPVEKAEQHIQAARKHLKKNNKVAAKKELVAADAALIYTEVDLPLSSTEHQVITAQKALTDKQFEKADKALKQAESGVQFLSASIMAPITQARNSIWQATKNFAVGNYDATKADLSKATAWLDKAAKSTEKTTRDEAVKLKDELEKLKGKASKAGKDTGSALTRLWQRSKALSDSEVEKASAGWGNLRDASHTRTDLIEAKLHLGYAQSAQFFHGKSAEVANELDQAKSYLNKAAKGSDKAMKAKINAMSAELKQLQAAIDNKGTQARTHYEKVKADLRQTIHDL